VELTTLEPSIRLNLRYATTNNFTGRAWYHEPRAFLQRPAAEALVRVHQTLAVDGFGLLVYDAYRPWSVTKGFWDQATPDQRRAGFVADPRAGSKHNRGCAVDVTLYHLSNGQPATMPTDFDDFTPLAAAHAPTTDAAVRDHRDRLRSAMEAEGFQPNPDEWWHFNHREWLHYPVLDLPIEAISHGVPRNAPSALPQ
jgi:D-alanyl-D-alanine dipeptidase